MANYRSIFASIAWRFVWAIAVLVLGSLVIKSGLSKVDGGGAYFVATPYLIFGLSLFVVSGIIMGPPLAGLVAEFLGNLFYWSEHYDAPLPVYGIPKTKRLKGLYQQAFDDLQKLSQEYPQELKAYVEMIDIAISDMKNPELASSVYHLGMEKLDEEKVRDVLEAYYKEIRSRA